MTQPAKTRVRVCSATDVGRVRSANEDAYGEFENDAGDRLLVVCDGMGGHSGGATASRLAIESFGEVFGRGQAAGEALLQEAMVAANERVFGAARDEPGLRGMGTTAVAFWLGSSGEAWVGHVGDSRAYRMRQGELEPLTSDHSVVAEMIRRGLITPEEAAQHPRRNEILRSIGVEPEAQPEIQRIELRTDDLLLLCSDGLCGVVTDAEIAELARSAAPEQAARALVDAANDAGGPDNVTVQLAAIEALPSSGRDWRPFAAVAAVAVLVSALWWFSGR